MSDIDQELKEVQLQRERLLLKRELEKENNRKIIKSTTQSASKAISKNAPIWGKRIIYAILSFAALVFAVNACIILYDHIENTKYDKAREEYVTKNCHQFTACESLDFTRTHQCIAQGPENFCKEMKRGEFSIMNGLKRY